MNDQKGGKEGRRAGEKETKRKRVGGAKESSHSLFHFDVGNSGCVMILTD